MRHCLFKIDPDDHVKGESEPGPEKPGVLSGMTLSSCNGQQWYSHTPQLCAMIAEWPTYLKMFFFVDSCEVSPYQNEVGWSCRWHSLRSMLL